MFYNNKFLLLSVLVLSIDSMPSAKASSPGDTWKFNTNVIDDNESNETIEPTKSSCSFALYTYVKAMEQPSILGLIKHSVDINTHRLKSIGSKLNNKPNGHDPDSNNLTTWEKYQLGGVGVMGNCYHKHSRIILFF